MIIFLLAEPWDSGITNLALDFARGLLTAGLPVRLFALAGTFPEKQAARLGIPVEGLKSRNTFFIIRQIVNYLKNCPVKVVHTFCGRSHLWGYYLKRFYPALQLVRSRADARPLRRRIFSGLLYRATDLVIAHAEFIASQYLNLFPEVIRRLVTLYPGIETAPFRRAGEQIRPRLRIGLIGRLDPIKGPFYFLEVIQKVKEELPGVSFLLAGEEKNIQRKAIAQRAEELGINQELELAGYLPDVAKAMAECQVGVICSLGSEAVSRVALEWLASGRPVVATRVGCLPELIVAGENGFLVNPGDVPGMADYLLFLLKNPEKAAEMGEKAQERVENLYQTKKTVQHLISLYIIQGQALPR